MKERRSTAWAAARVRTGVFVIAGALVAAPAVTAPLDVRTRVDAPAPPAAMTNFPLLPPAPETWIVWPAAKPSAIQSPPSVRVIVSFVPSLPNVTATFSAVTLS